MEKVNMTGLYIFIPLCVLSLAQIIVYSIIKVKGKGPAYTISKCIGSLIFIAAAVAAMIISGFDLHSALMLAAFLFSGFGDYYLSLDSKHKRLKTGASCFLAAHCTFIAAFISIGSFHWLTLPITAVLFAAEVAAAKIGKINFYGIEKGVAAYILTVSAMAVQACSLAVIEAFSPFALLSACGAVLFLISDLIWVCYGLNKNSSQHLLKVLNVVTYFPAQMLLAGAMLLFAK